MSVPSRFILHQAPAIAGLARVATAAATAPLRRMIGGECRRRPSRRFEKLVEPPSPDLVRSYSEHVGAEMERYDGRLPPHMFPQWSFGLLTRTLQHLTLPLHQMVNGGCRLEVDGPLPAGRPIRVGAELVEVEERPGSWRFHHRIENGPVDREPRVVAHVFNVLVRRRSEESSSDESGDDGRPAPSAEADELERWRLDEEAGFDFAKLTGDFNPIHWLAPAAQAAGFESTILHGFATMARAYEGLSRAYPEVEDLESLDVRFTRPLVLPANVGLWVERETDRSGKVYVADGRGEAAYLVGDFAA